AHVRRGRRPFLDHGLHIHADVDEPARIVRHARAELAAVVVVADVEADGGLAHFLDGAATLHVALDRDTLDLRGLDGGRAAVGTIVLVAGEAAHGGTGDGGGGVAAAVADLVAEHAADDCTQDRARADGGAGIGAGDLPIL